MTSAAVDAFQFKPVHVYLVEDNLDDIELMRRALKKGRLAHRLTVERDGEKALDFLLGCANDPTDADVPDLIFLDLNVPKINGIELLQEIRKHAILDLVPVVTLTSSGRDTDIAKSYRSGANTYIQKPVEFAKILHAVETLTEYWIVLARLPGEAA